jgi:prevent-host-death family protein
VKTVTAFEAKTHLSELLAEASRGETIVVTRRGEPIAQIGPLREAQTEARDAMRFLLSQKIKLGVSARKAVEEGRRR